MKDSHFPRKRVYFSTHFPEFEEQKVDFDVQCCSMKRGVHLD